MNVAADEHTVKTYRYLRLAMVVLIVLLLASVTYERVSTPAGCFETSISAYWYTPARSVFVATLVALGVCMVVIKATDGWEDIALNVGGVLAAVVAFVPTSDTGSCVAGTFSSADATREIDNSVWSLVVAGVVGIVITVAVALRQGDLRRDDVMAGRNLAGIAVSVVLLVGGVAWFAGRHDSFVAHAHDVAAVGLFVSITAVVALNARSGRLRSYLVIAVLMVVLGLGLVATQWIGFDHWLLVAEATVIALFAVFWLIQTDELWNVGPRPRRQAHPVGSPP